MDFEQTVTLPAGLTVKCPLHGCEQRMDGMRATARTEETKTPNVWIQDTHITYTVLPCGHEIPEAALAGITWLIDQQVNVRNTRSN